jgi:hypothetical protein
MSRIATNSFAELTATGQTASYELPGDICAVDVYLDDTETYGGGTLKLQSSPDGGTTWVDVPSASWTSGDGHLGAFTVYGRTIRFDLAGATSPSLTVTIKAKSKSLASVVYANLTDNGNTTLVLGKPPTGAFIFAVGTWDSGSLTFAWSPDGGSNYYDSGVAAITADGGAALTNAGSDVLGRLVLGSVVTAADIDVWVYYF